MREIAEAQTARQRRLAQNELVGLVDIERQRSKQVPAAFSRIAFFAAGFGAVVGLSAQLAYGRGWRAATTSLLVGFVAALACGGYGRAARAEARRLSVLTRSLTEFWESESTGVPSDGVKS